MDTRKNKEALIVIVSIVIIIAVFYLFVNPTVAKLKNYNYLIATKGEDLKRAEENLDNLKNLQTALNTKSDEVNSLMSALPSFVDTEELIINLEAIANKNGVVLTGVMPVQSEAGVEEGEAMVASGDKSSGGIAEAKFDLTVKGSFRNIQKFFVDLEANRRPLNVSKISFSKQAQSGGNGAILSATISLTTYYALKS